MPSRASRRGWIGFGLFAAAYLVSAALVFRSTVQSFPRDDRVVIRFAHWQIETGPREAFAAVAARYMQLHPHTRIEQIAVPMSVYQQWLRTQLESDNPPDLVEFDPVLRGMEDALPRYFEPITRWLQQPNPYNAGTPLAGHPWRETFIDGLHNRAAYSTTLRNYYGASVAMHSMRLFYNEPLLREIAGSTGPPRDFRSWLALGDRLRARYPQKVLIAGSRDNALWTMDQLIGGGLSRFFLESDPCHRLVVTPQEQFENYLRGGWSYRSPAVQTGLRMLRAYGEQMSPSFLQLDRNSAVQHFVRGEALMLPTGTWDVTSLRSLAPFPIGAIRLPLPRLDDPDFGGYLLGPASDGVVSTALPLFLNRRSAHKEAALDFLRFLTSQPGDRLFSQVSGWMPSILGVELPEFMQPMKISLEGYSTAVSLIYGPGAATARNWQTNMHRLFAPDGGPAAFTDALAAGERAAVRDDLRATLATTLADLRRREPALAALALLDSPGTTPGLSLADEQLTPQNLIETRAYLLRETLAATRTP